MPDVAVNEDNQFLVVWADDRYGYAIYGQLIDESGNLIGDNIFVNDKDINIVSNSVRPYAANGKDFIVVWSDQRNGYVYDIYGQKFEKDGNKIGNNFIVNSDSQMVSKYIPNVALSKNGSFIVTWYDYNKGGLFSRIYCER